MRSPTSPPTTAPTAVPAQTAPYVEGASAEGVQTSRARHNVGTSLLGQPNTNGASLTRRANVYRGDAPNTPQPFPTRPNVRLDVRAFDPDGPRDTLPFRVYPTWDGEPGPAALTQEV